MSPLLLGAIGALPVLVIGGLLIGYTFSQNSNDESAEISSTSSSSAQNASATDSSSTAANGAVATAELGACLVVADVASDVTSIPTVDCSEDHDAQVVGKYDLADQADYPGTDAVVADAESRCVDEFESFIGEAYADSALSLSYVYPTQETWDQADDREVICFAVSDEMVTTSWEAGVVVAPPDGTIDNPGVVGQDHVYSTDAEGTLTVTPLSVDWNANDEVALANRFNDPPADGMVYIIVTLQVDYAGTGHVTPWLDADVQYLNNGRSYEETSRSIDDSLYDIGDLYDGGSATGAVVLEVPADDVESGLIVIGLRWQDPLWFAAN